MLGSSPRQRPISCQSQVSALGPGRRGYVSHGDSSGSLSTAGVRYAITEYYKSFHRLVNLFSCEVCHKMRDVVLCPTLGRCPEQLQPLRRKVAGELSVSVAVAARRLGVAPATLRTWDRRYGLGPSQRDGGTHRRYSHVDLARLDYMSALVRAGNSPAQAAAAALAREFSGTESLADLGATETTLPSGT